MAAIMILSVAGHKAYINEKVKGEAVERDCPPLVKVAGTVYVDTGYQNAMVTCGTADGEIKTTVKETKRPANNDESNFGKGYADPLIGEKAYWRVVCVFLRRRLI